MEPLWSLKGVSKLGFRAEPGVLTPFTGSQAPRRGRDPGIPSREVPRVPFYSFASTRSLSNTPRPVGTQVIPADRLASGRGSERPLVPRRSRKGAPRRCLASGSLRPHISSRAGAPSRGPFRLRRRGRRVVADVGGVGRQAGFAWVERRSGREQLFCCRRRSGLQQCRHYIPLHVRLLQDRRHAARIGRIVLASRRGHVRCLPGGMGSSRGEVNRASSSSTMFAF
jgi:hypothetical protein